MFPPVENAARHGVLAWGGDLSPFVLISAYSHGVFPYYEEEPILWYAPHKRMILKHDEFNISRSLKKTMKRGEWTNSVDKKFEEVIKNCRNQRLGETWITEEMLTGYITLHKLGLAHSFEVYWREELVGGSTGYL